MKDLHEKNQNYLANIYNLAFGGTICKSDTQINYYYFVPSIKALSPPNIYTTGSDLTELLTASAQMKNPQTALDNTKVMILKGSGTDLAKASHMAVEALKKQVEIEEILKKLEQKKTVAKVSFESCLMDSCYQEAQLEQRTMDVLKEVIEIVNNGGRDV
jgi:hypothetical protein